MRRPAPPALWHDPGLPHFRQRLPSLAELDHYPWKAGIAGEAFGVRLGIRLNDPEAVPLLSDYLPHGWRPLAAPAPIVDRLFSLRVEPAGTNYDVASRPVLYYVDAQGPYPFPTLADALHTLQMGATQAIAEMTPRYVFVHAGAVAWQDQAILVPGDTFSGKSTLVAALVCAGATYYSDEYAILDGRGQVHPFPQPLGLRAPGELVQERWPVEVFGGNSGVTRIPVGLVVATRYQAGATWQPRRLSLAEGVSELLVNSPGLSREPERILDVLHRAASGAILLGGARGEAMATAPAMLDYVAGTR